MLVVIKTSGESRETCYVTRLTAQEMGSFSDIQRQVETANETGELLQSNGEREVQYVRSNITLDAATLGPNASGLCRNAEIVMLQKQVATGDGKFKFLNV